MTNERLCKAVETAIHKCLEVQQGSLLAIVLDDDGKELGEVGFRTDGHSELGEFSICRFDEETGVERVLSYRVRVEQIAEETLE